MAEIGQKTTSRSPARRLRLLSLRRRDYNCVMQPLHKASFSAGSAADCASEILELVPAIMRLIRAHMRRHRGSDLSVPQFRALAFVDANAGASLSALAEHVGLSLPATSRLVEGLVQKGMIVRRVPRGNRRLVALTISAHGQRTVSAARQATVKRLTEILAPLGGGERVAILRALRTLHHEFDSAAARDGLVIAHS
jgi:DNA-binding MarR family transcriptional regulator